jgi:hypothetical protein
MLVTSRNVLGPAIDEIFRRTADFDEFARPLVFSPKLDHSLPNVTDTALRDWRATGIPPSILKEMFN